ncbi:MAG: twin-arginine translocation signal domain-containing protein [Fimbriimonadaceae bacterium]|nr:twin-arginine translocation signal domain-containing protein [Alphaproteobacteria bacterium]
MSKSDDRKIADRRDFLKLAGLGTVVGGAAFVTGKASVEAAENTADGKTGYRETDHVKTTYELARF